jgi:3-hydroxyacyl-[acyl-carrier-protein] dehydratase
MASERVLKSIPHRPPFLFVDSVEALDADHIVTKREVRSEEYFFEGHYPGNPIMPGVLLCEAVFQSAAIYIVDQLKGGETTLENKTPVLARIIEAKFKHMVRPGDVVTIEVRPKEILKNFHFMRGNIRNEAGKLVLAIEFALTLVE